MFSKVFYTKYKGTISPIIFAGDILHLIQKACKYCDMQISVDELYSLHTAIFNSALSQKLQKFSELVEDIKKYKNLVKK